MDKKFKRSLRVLLKAFLSLFVVSSMFVVAFGAGAPPPYSVIEDGSTFLRTFKVKNLPQEQIDFFRSVMGSARGVILYTVDNTYSFFIVPSGSSLVLSNRVGGSSIDVSVSPTSSFTSLSFRRVGEFFEVVDYSHNGVGFLTSLVVSGSYWNTYNFPTLSYDYLADITGSLTFETDELDGGDTGGGDTGGGDTGGGGILDWLTNFWTKFVEVLKSIFIPSANYFSNFFSEIKNAFDSKLGGLGKLLDSLSSSFNGLKTVNSSSSLVIKLPDNFLFRGYDGFSVDVLKPLSSLILFVRNIFNAFLVVVTVIICYHKAIAIVNS